MTQTLTINFRPLEENEFDFAVRAFSNCPQAFDNKPEEIAKNSIGKEGCFVIQSQQASIGILNLKQYDKRIDIIALSLCPEFRGTPQKYGTKTIGILQACARKITRNLTLEVRNKNKKAIKLYEKIGFEPCHSHNKKIRCYIWKNQPKLPHEPEFDIDLLEQLFDRENQIGPYNWREHTYKPPRNMDLLDELFGPKERC